MSFSSSLTMLATVLEKVDGPKDALGARRDQWKTVATDVPCRVTFTYTKPSTRHAVESSQSVTYQPTVYMLYRTDVKSRQRLKINDELFDVIHVDDPGGKHHHLTLTTELVRG